MGSPSEQRYPDLPPGWRRARLGELLTLRKDIVHPRDRPTGEALFVGLEHVESGTGRRLGSLTVSLEGLTGRKPRFQKDDVVYGYLRPYLNKVWLAEFDGLCSVDQYVYRVETRMAVAEFVAWFMRSPLYLTRAPIAETPGQLPRIRTEEVASVPLDLPPLDEQRRLVASIRGQLAAVERARAAAEARLAAIVGLRQARLNRVEELLGRAPHRVESFGSLVESYRNGYGRRPSEVEDGPVVLRLADVSSGRIDLGNPRRGLASAAERETFSLKAGDLLFVRVNGSAELVGRCVLVPELGERVLFNDHLIRVRLRAGVLPSFIRMVMDFRSIRTKLVTRASTSAGQLTVNQDALAELPIPVPPGDVQARLVRDLEDGTVGTAALRQSAGAELAAISALPAALLRRAFSGEL